MGRSSGVRSSAVRSSSATRTTDFPSTSQFGLRRYGSESFLATPLGRPTGSLVTPRTYPSIAFLQRFNFSQRLFVTIFVSYFIILVTRNSVIPDSTRKTKAQNAQRLLEILQQDSAFFATLGLQNGMKSMTSKQFIGIIDYMFKSITGKDLQALVGKDDQFDCIIRILKRLNYPLKINKSMLKTPNTPHSIDQIFELLLWLSDYTLNFNEAEHSATTQDDNFPSHAFTAIFSKTVMDGFHLWSKESEEFVDLQGQMVDKYTSATVNNKVENAQQLITMTEHLKSDSAELRALSTTIPDQQYVEELESRFLSFEQQHQEATIEREEYKKSLKAIHEQCSEAERRFYAIEKELHTRRELIRKQKYSRDMYNALAQEIDLLKVTVDIANTEIKDFKEVESSHAINRARVLNQLKIAVPAMAKHLNKVVSFIETSRMDIDANTLHSLSIDVSVSAIQIQHVHKINGILRQITAFAQSYLNEITLQNEHVNVKASSLRTEQSLVMQQLNELREKHKKLLMDIELRDGVSKMNNQKFENVKNRMKEIETEYNIQYHGKQQAIARSREKIMLLEASNNKLIDDGEQQVHAKIQQRNEQMAQMQTVEDEVDAFLTDLGL